jgi:hypothetical protein
MPLLERSGDGPNDRVSDLRLGSLAPEIGPIVVPRSESQSLSALHHAASAVITSTALTRDSKAGRIGKYWEAT